MAAEAVHRRRRPAWVVIAAALAALASSPAWAQTVSSAVAGTVRGSGGRPAAGAVVEARSAGTGLVRSAATDREGRYRIEPLPPGTWMVVARSGEGVASETRTAEVRLQQTVHVDLTLGKGLTEVVTVRTEAPLVDTHRAAGEIRVGVEQSVALPSLRREATDVALIDSAVRATPPGNFYGERGSVFVINGQTGRSNSFLVDGLDNNDRTSGMSPNAFFSQLAIKEYVLLTQRYAAEFGRASGGVFNVVTGQGSNVESGEMFVQGSAAAWNSAGRLVSSLPGGTEDQQASSRYALGFGIGGPLRRDRAFYFATYERQEADEIVPYVGTGRDGVAGGWMKAPSRVDNLFLRTDWNLSPSQSLTASLSADARTTSGLNVGASITPEAGHRVHESDVKLVAALTTVFSPSLFNEARMLVGTSSWEQRANSARPGADRPTGVFGGNNLNRQLRDEDRIELLDNATWRIGSHTLKAGVDLLRSKTTVRARFNPLGNFLYDFGGRTEYGDGYHPPYDEYGNYDESLYRDCVYSYLITPYQRSNEPVPPIPCPGRAGLDDDGDGLVDEPALAETYSVVYMLVDGEPEARQFDTQIGVFVQDSWQASSRFVLDYGLRYDRSTFRLPPDARVESVIPNGGAPVDTDNVGPRLSFAWTPGRDGRLVVRGGAGIFYDKIPLGFPAVAAITSGTRFLMIFPKGMGLEIGENEVENPLYFEQLLAALEALYAYYPEMRTRTSMRFTTGTRLDTPYSKQFSVGAELTIGKGAMLGAEVTRVLGYHLPLYRDLNPTEVAGTDEEGYPEYQIDNQGIPLHSPDPANGSIVAIVTEGRSWYTGLDVRWRWQGEAGWYSASYTWSKSLDLGPDPLKGGISLPPDSFDLWREKGRSDMDRRHRLVVAGESALPWMGLRASGTIQWSSGAPFDVVTGKDSNSDGVLSERPIGVVRNSGASTPLEPVNALREAEGLPPVDSLTEPSFFQLDLRVAKPFVPAWGNGRGELYLQVYNLLDRFNGGLVDGRVNSVNFGRAVVAVGPPRTLELGVKLGY